MSSQSLVDRLEVTLREQLPNCEVEAPLQRFSWRGSEENRFFSTTIRDRGTRRPVVIRQSKSEEAHDLEIRLYNQVLPRLSIRTPSLLAAFGVSGESPNWMVLEKLEGEEASANSKDQRQRILAALGTLHLEGIELERSGQLTDVSLPLFDAGSARFQKWRSILEAGLVDGSHSLMPWMPSCLDAVLAVLPGLPTGLIHNDLDLSNILVTEDGTVGLVDWEKGGIGPPSVDLGLFMQHVAAAEELRAYHEPLASVPNPGITIDDVTYWADVGRAFRLFHEICYCVNGGLKGRGPAPGWLERYYEPCIPALEIIAKRNQWDG